MVTNTAHQSVEVLDFNAVDALIAGSIHVFKPRPVLGKMIPMRELTFADWLTVAQRYPQVVALFDGVMPSEDGKVGADARELIAGLGPEPIAAIVATACGRGGDVAFEKSFIASPPEVLNALGIQALVASIGDGGLEGFFSMLAEGLQEIAERETALQATIGKTTSGVLRKSGRKTGSKKAAHSSAS